MKVWPEFFTYLRVPGEMDPAKYGVDLGTAEPIDRAESSVYAACQRVTKVYDGFMSHLIDWPVLCKYQYLTERVRELISNNPRLNKDFRVVPVEKIGRLPGRATLCSVSEFIPGDNLLEVANRQSVEERGLMIAVFNRLNAFLQRETGEDAIRIDFTNAKLDPETGIITITDVCGQIATLNPRYKDQPAIFC